MVYNHQLSYTISGSGEPLLFIHGFGIGRDIWHALLPRLIRHYQCITVDLPGIGMSAEVKVNEDYFSDAAGAIRSLREKLHISRWGVVAYSIGADVAATYTRLDATHITKIMLLLPMYVQAPQQKILSALLQLDTVSPAFGEWLLSGQQLAKLIELLGFNGRAGAESRRWHTSMSRQPLSTLRAMLRALVVCKFPTFPATLPRLTIWGQYDVVATRPKDVAGGQHVTLPCTHAGVITHAKEIAAAIDSFAK